WTAGVVMVPFEYVDAPPEIRYGLADCGARWLIVHEEKLDHLANVGLAGTAVEAVFVVGTPREHQRAFASLLETPPRPSPDAAATLPGSRRGHPRVHPLPLGVHRAPQGRDPLARLGGRHRRQRARRPFPRRR